jgi:hypothetical protein
MAGYFASNSVCSKCILSFYYMSFDVITSIKSMESMECMYEKVFRCLTACPVTLLRFVLLYVTFCVIHRNIM